MNILEVVEGIVNSVTGGALFIGYEPRDGRGPWFEYRRADDWPVGRAVILRLGDRVAVYSTSETCRAVREDLERRRLAGEAASPLGLAS